MRNKEILNKWKKLGLDIPQTFQEWRSWWDGEGNDECYQCEKEDVKTMFEIPICYTCYLKDWKNNIMYDTDLTKTHAWELKDEAFAELEKYARTIKKDIKNEKNQL